MTLSWKHYALAACTIGAGTAEILAHYVQAGGSLPWHLTAGLCLMASSWFGMVSRSISPGSQ